MAHMPRAVAEVTHPDQLPERQRQVLTLPAEGKTDKAIAHELGVALQTVKNHCTLLYRRLPRADVGSPRTAAAVWYLRFAAVDR